MKRFFEGVRKHLNTFDAEQLREQYALISDEADFLDTLFRTIAQGIIVLNKDGHIIKSNPAAKRLLGMEPEDALKTLELPLGKASKRELEVTYPEARTLEVQTLPADLGTIVYLRDITAERVRTEEELRAGATEAVRHLASGVAHEIGNPLNALSLSLQMMQNAKEKDDETLAICRQQVERLDGILKGFLAALRPSKPNLLPGNVADPLHNCLAALKTQFEERRISVALDVASALPSVALDAAQIEQVFFNLIKNALEAIPDGGRLAIRLTADDNEVTLAFRDNGVGIAPEEVLHLFEPYRTSKEHGNGLGLMVSSRIVHDHGGTIAAESEVGRGTTFTVRLPRLEKRIRRLNG